MPARDRKFTKLPGKDRWVLILLGIKGPKEA